MRNYIFLSLIAVMASSIASTSAEAGILGKVIREAAEAIVKTGTVEGLELGAKSASKKVAKEYAELAAKRAASKTVMSFTDDAVRLAGSQSAALSLADDAAKATAKLSSRNARRLAMMADDIEKSGKTPELIKHLAENAAADQCVDFLWRNKGAILTGAAITTVMMNPEIISEPVSRIGEVAVDATAREIVHPLTGGTMIGTWMFLVIGVFVSATGLTVWLRTRRLRKWISWFGVMNPR